MALLRSLDDDEFSAGIARLVQAWEANLIQVEIMESLDARAQQA